MSCVTTIVGEVPPGKNLEVWKAFSTKCPIGKLEKILRAIHLVLQICIRNIASLFWSATVRIHDCRRAMSWPFCVAWGYDAARYIEGIFVVDFVIFIVH